MTRLPIAQIQSAKRTDLLDLLADSTPLQRVAAAEWAGPCPFCGGEDRFHVQPGRGRWFCRQCTGEPEIGGWRDVIDFVRQQQNLSFRQAVLWLSDGAQQSSPPSLARLKPRSRRSHWQSASWQRQAWAEVRAGQTLLADTAGTLGRSTLQSRGLDPATWRAWRLGLMHAWHPLRRRQELALLLPWITAHRLCAVQYRFIATDLQKRERFAQRPGGERLLFGLHLLQDRPWLLLVEGELNALSLWQVTGQQADVLSWGPQNNILRPSVLVVVRQLVCQRQRVVLWADEAEVARSAAQALAGSLCPSTTMHAVSSPHGRDANDLLVASELTTFLQPLLAG